MPDSIMPAFPWMFKGVGAAVGAGAGTAGAAYTGNKEIVLPAESTLSFKLAEPITIKI